MEPPEACPVDHKAPPTSSDQTCPIDHSTKTPPTPAAETPAGVCPIDHKSREAWMKHTRSTNPDAFAIPHPIPQTPPAQSWASTIRSYLPFSGNATPAQQRASPTRPVKNNGLETAREISTIPRAPTSPEDPTVRPSNHEIETGADPTSGNWVYPSEKMFFEAMQRKGHAARVADMKTVVPIHNAVNERAWAEIKEWEAPYLGTCGGPKLVSFAGLSTQLTPKARVMTWMGYTAPFDRHDWVVERCGTTVDYVIDFYPGRPRSDGIPSFYLDVRPKLNSWEGVKMRILRGVGLN